MKDIIIKKEWIDFFYYRGSELLVLGYLYQRTEGSKFSVCCSYEEMAKDLNLSKSTIIRAIESLNKGRTISIFYGDKTNANVYTLNVL